MNDTPEAPRKTRFHRLLIGFNHHVECRSVLNFAGRVAQAAEVELAGVFVEDQDLFDLARLPFSTEILAASGAIRNLDTQRVESDLRAVAVGTRDALRKLAEQMRRQYSFRTVRGHFLRDLIALANADDLILLRAANYPWRERMPRAGAPPGPVLLLQPPGKGNGDLVSLAREIARSMNVPVSISEDCSDPATLRDLRASLIIVPASIFSRAEDIDRFAAAAGSPLLIVPSTRPSLPSGH